MPRWLIPLLLLAPAVLGCARPGPEIASDERHITLDEWRRLPPEEKNDPYVLQRLQRKPPDRPRRLQ